MAPSETFTHEVSEEYSSRWNGGMIYDTVDVYVETLENDGRLHNAKNRLTVGYTIREG
jgi:hypothetical protein